MAAALVRAAAAAPPGDHLRDQPPPARRRPAPLPGRRRPRRAREPDRGGRRAQESAWPTSPSSARTAPTAWRRSTPTCCARRRSRTWPRCSPSASTTRPTASRRGAGCCWPTRRWPARSPRPSATAGSPTSASCARLKPLADDAGFRDAFREAKREAKSRFADWLQVDVRADGRSGHDLRLPGQAHPRVQAAAAQRAAHRRALQPAAGEPEPRDAAADVLLRRQGGAGLPPGQAHHQVHQQPRRHHRRRPGGARPAQGRVPARLLRVAGRAADPGQRRLQPDLDRRLRGQRHEQHEVHDERRADDRHARRRDDRDGRGGRRGELLPVRPDRRAGGRQPRLVQPALALRQRAGDPRGAGPDLLRPLQPQRAGRLRAAARHAADARRPLHAPGGPAVLPGGGRRLVRAVRRPGRAGRARRS